MVGKLLYEQLDAVSTLVNGYNIFFSFLENTLSDLSIFVLRSLRDFPQIRLINFLLFLFFYVLPRHANIMMGKGSNIFDEWAARCLHLFQQEEECTSSSWGDSKMHTSSRIANWYRMQTEIKESDQNKDLIREFSEHRYTVYRSGVLKITTFGTIDIIFI